MKATREVRRLMNRLRKRYAGRNGVIYSGLLDIVWLERAESNNAKSRIRRKGAVNRELHNA